MTVDDLTSVLLSFQLISIRDNDYNDLYYGKNDKLDDKKHKDILNKEVIYIEIYNDVIIITVKKEGII